MAENKNKKVVIREPLFATQKMDYVFLITVLALLAIGLIMMFSASYPAALQKTGDSYYYIKNQAPIALFGIFVMLFVSKINYTWYRKIKPLIPLFYIAALGILCLTLVIGFGPEGVRRWIRLGPVSLQASELAKTAVIFALALYVSKFYSKMGTFLYGIIYPGIIIIIPAALVVKEPHLSGAIIIVAIGGIIMVAAGAKIRYFAAFALTAVTGATYMILTNPYMQLRIKYWLQPESDPLGKGFHTLQSLYAIGSGGLTGLGFGNSRQKFLYLPEPQNDYVFAIVCEELGFIGAFLIICLFAFLIYRGYIIALRSKDKFGAVLVIGIISRIAVQTLLNLAVVTNAIPVTGISLPFFSFGGTALLMLLAEMGIVLAVSRYSNLNKV